MVTLIWKVLIALPFCNLREERIWQRTKVSLIRLLRIWPLSFDPREVHVNKTVGFIMHSKNIIWNLIPARAYIIKRTKYQNDDSHLRIFPWEFIWKWCLKLSNLYLWNTYVNGCSRNKVDHKMLWKLGSLSQFHFLGLFGNNWIRLNTSLNVSYAPWVVSNKMTQMWAVKHRPCKIFLMN